MRVLITNNTLDARAGSEMYVRDLSLALLRRGHQPIAYSTKVGAIGAELRAATVPVLDNLAQLAVAPDIIHGQHHLDAMTAMLHFPQVPAIYVCHGWVPTEELPPKFPTIRHYVAVDDLCAERLQCEHGIAPERIRTIRNFVDLRRFALRDSLPERPRRALVFSNTAREDGYLGVIRQACAERGIAVDAIGAGSQRSEAAPEKHLADYDIVFAKARSAMEAMASGAAVIACDAAGLAGMVTEDNYASWRRLNFGVRTLRDPITVANILRELARYDAQQAHKLALRLRADADMEPAIDAIVDVYSSAIADHCSAATEAPTQLAAASEYLRGIAVEFKQRGDAERQRSIAQAETSTQHLRAERAEQQYAATMSELRALQQASNTDGSAQQHQGPLLRRTIAARRAIDEQQALLSAIQQHASERAAHVGETIKTPFWRLLSQAFSVRNSHLESLSARLRLLLAQNTGDELIESIRDESLPHRFTELASVHTAGGDALRLALTALLARSGIRSLVEVACGHCYWLRGAEALLAHYTGIDVSEEVIAQNRRDFATQKWEFRIADAVSDDLPAADAVLCRDYLEHLPTQDIVAVLARTQRSGARYLLATNHGGITDNCASDLGNWRPLNLTRAPFNLPAPVEQIPLHLKTGKMLGAWLLRRA